MTIRPIRPLRRLTAGIGAAALLAAALGTIPAAAETDDYEVLVVGKTLGFRHSHIPVTTEAIIDLGAEHGFTVDVWDAPNDSAGWWGPGSPGQPDLTLPSTPFTSAEELARYSAIVFVSPVDNTNSLDPDLPRLLDDDELAALQGYIRAGGGFVGLHAATDTMHTVPWYSALTGGGARFINHPAIQPATMHVESPAHPSMDGVPLAWERVDEWYNYSVNPREDVHVLMTLDESTYSGGSMGDDHPIAWCHNFEGGRSWHQGAGHTDESYADPVYLAHILGGIEWAAGVTSGGGNCVTWGEVEAIVAELPTDSARDRVAVRQVSQRLEAAEEAADAGDRRTALRELHVAERLTGALVTDDEAADLLAGKIADLSDWQQGLSDADL
jgi:type 1 glutamine amidotransferase